MRSFTLEHPGSFTLATHINFGTGWGEGYRDNFTNYHSGWSSWRRPYYSNPILLDLSNFFRVGIIPNITGSANADSKNVRLGPPRNMEFSLEHDRVTYGSILGNIGVASAIFGRYNDLSGQKRVEHFTAEGILLKDSDTTYVSGTSNIRGQDFDVHSPEGCQQYDALGDPVGTQPLIYTTDDVQAYVDHMNANYVGYVASKKLQAVPWGNLTIDCWLFSDIEYGYDSELDRHSFSYEITVRFIGPNWTQRHVDKMTVTIDPQVLVEYNPDYLSGHLMHIRSETISIPYSSGPVWSSAAHVGHYEDWYLHLPVHTYAEVPSDGDTVTYRDDVIHELLAFSENFNKNFFLKYSGSCIASTTDAFEGFNKLVESNYIETIAELRALQSLTDNWDHFKDFLKLVAKSGGLQSLINLANVTANAILLYSFGVSPVAADIREISSKWNRIMSRRSEFQSTLYGKSTHTFECDGIPVTLVTRTTARYRVSPHSWLSSLLPLRQLGVEPTPSNLWDLVPFSFAADWIFSIGDRMNYLTSAQYMLFGEVKYYVHSYTVYINFNDIPGYTGEGQLVLYRREVSSYFPYPHPLSNQFHDWLGSVSVPPLVAGALAWALIRA